MRMRPTSCLFVFLFAALCGCGDEDGGTETDPTASAIKGMPSRALSEDEQALVGVYGLEIPGAEGAPVMTVELELFDGGVQRFTIRNPHGAPADTVQTNEGVWWLEGVDRLLLSARRSQGEDLAAGSVSETVLRITEAGLQPDAEGGKPLVRKKP